MKASVTQLYRRGRKIPRDKKTPVNIGEFCMMEAKNDVLCRLVMSAMLFDDRSQIIDPLWDARVLGAHKDGMLVRGIEIHGDHEVAQEWWVRFGDFVETKN